MSKHTQAMERELLQVLEMLSAAVRRAVESAEHLIAEDVIRLAQISGKVNTIAHRAERKAESRRGARREGKTEALFRAAAELCEQEGIEPDPRPNGPLHVWFESTFGHCPALRKPPAIDRIAAAMRERTPYRLRILDPDTNLFCDPGEGPWDSLESARRFAEAEVGQPWVIIKGNDIVAAGDRRGLVTR